MKLASTEHTRRHWRIEELTHEFRLEDVWVVADGIECGDFAPFVAGIVTYDPLHSASKIVRALFAARARIGRWLGLDAPAPGASPDGPSLRSRMATDLSTSATPAFTAVPFRSLYLTDDEFAAEAANRTVHGILHLGCVADGSGRGRVQLAILVRPQGRLGRCYMAAIKPFRHLIYPAMMRELAAAGIASVATQYALGD